MWHHYLAVLWVLETRLLPFVLCPLAPVFLVSISANSSKILSSAQYTATRLFRVLDTFASKVAAIQDKYADASVGNVTGSNAVNVFLGIGLAWFIASIYHTLKGDAFEVEPGT